MAQKVQVLLTCDMHGDDTAGEQTIAFALDGATYEIDVCDQHGDELRDAVAPFVGAARRAGGRVSTPSRRTASSNGRRPSSRGDLAQVREWARGQGIGVSERGRVAASVLEKYDAAH